MKHIRLPSDIREYVERRVRKRILLCVACELAVILLLLFIGERLFGAMGIVLQSIAYIVLLILPPLLTGVPFKLMDRSWCGTVKKVHIETKSMFDPDKRVETIQNPRLHHRNVIILTVETPKGEIIQRTVANYNANLKPEHYINEFQEGDFVYQFYGVPYPLSVGHDRERSSCVICGQETPSDRSHCWNCGHTLIKLSK